jgi:hypothetical protein
MSRLVFAAQWQAPNASALILRLFAEGRRDEWENFRRRDPAKFSRILECAGGGGWKLSFWRQSESTSSLDVLTPETWRSYEDPPEIASHLPAPDVEWRLARVVPMAT